MFFRMHGGNGTGKSYPIYRLLKDFPRTEFWWPAQLCPNRNKTKEKLVGYVLTGDLFICGKYDGNQTGGGDALDDFTYHYPWLGDYVTRTFTHVIYESMMGSLSNPRYFVELEDKMREEGHKCQGMIHLMQDVKWPVVEQRLIARRANNPSLATKPINLDKMLSNYLNATRYFHRYESEHSRQIAKLDPDCAYEQFREHLRKGGWEY